MGIIPWKVRSIPLIALLKKKKKQKQKDQTRLRLYPIIVLCALVAVGSTGTTLGALWT